MNTLTIVSMAILVLLAGGILFLRPTLARRCPYCLEDVALDRLPRPLLLKIALLILPTKTYRCQSCLKMFLMIGK